eukprot:CAMPEP_0170230068 /NCGR_PEP_ID=MMETSP0116_2-20130129/14763_1 /TAXON_ID=400756 /ORGANISM="Durinskia baltica, Strain CSIRO CS-38" /LENGTH=324 /DNA_ID=CAMNT_0010480829 /DNA_START=158 /DNA_END=1129 /DNA_ORIENTATION=-
MRRLVQCGGGFPHAVAGAIELRQRLPELVVQRRHLLVEELPGVHHDTGQLLHREALAGHLLLDLLPQDGGVLLRLLKAAHGIVALADELLDLGFADGDLVLELLDHLDVQARGRDRLAAIAASLVLLLLLVEAGRSPGQTERPGRHRLHHPGDAGVPATAQAAEALDLAHEAPMGLRVLQAPSNGVADHRLEARRPLLPLADRALPSRRQLLPGLRVGINAGHQQHLHDALLWVDEEEDRAAEDDAVECFNTTASSGASSSSSSAASSASSCGGSSAASASAASGAGGSGAGASGGSSTTGAATTTVCLRPRPPSPELVPAVLR